MRCFDQGGLQKSVSLSGKRAAFSNTLRFPLRRAQPAVTERMLGVGEARRLTGLERPCQSCDLAHAINSPQPCNTIGQQSVGSQTRDDGAIDALQRFICMRLKPSRRLSSSGISEVLISAEKYFFRCSRLVSYATPFSISSPAALFLN